jgi:hypothetical protein
MHDIEKFFIWFLRIELAPEAGINSAMCEVLRQPGEQN